MKKIVIIFSTFSLLGAIALGLLFLKVNKFGIEHVYNDQSGQQLTLILKKGDSATSVLNQLQNHDVFEHIILAKLWLKLRPEFSKVKKGYYEFPAETSVEAIFDVLSKGKVRQFSISLIEGLTLAQWMAEFRKNEAIDYDIINEHWLYDKTVDTTNSFCLNDYQLLEGCLLANTYFFDYQTKASEIIKRAYKSMGVVIDKEWSERFPDTAYTSKYDLLIMASIIEKETAVESERGLISGVFDNRLKRNMRLQTDPTVIYGIGKDFDGNLTRKHLRQKTPYNTYVIKGLPITPIAMAGQASISAAAKPELTEAVYFVAKGDGTHQFSETLAEHNAAVREYQLNKGKR